MLHSYLAKEQGNRLLFFSCITYIIKMSCMHSFFFLHKVNAHIEKVSERSLLEQQTVSETWEDDTAYMRDEPTEEPGDVVPAYRSKQMRYGITSTFAIGKSQAYSARLSDRYKLHACIRGCMTFDTYTPLSSSLCSPQP